MCKSVIAIRNAVPSDAAAIAEIYRPYVENTAVSFEYEAPDAAEMERRIGEIKKKYPYIVAVQSGKIVGYAYASVFKARAAYDGCVEVSVYLEENSRGQGIGSFLYRVLEKKLKAQGIQHAYACISYPDHGEDSTLTKDSVNFHYAKGYSMCAYFKDCGFKFGRYYSMVWMEKTL
ncbi:MAG: N-acetyltransferase [Clostridia bacterium]|nr:N-acetyltransferase [Clostridia bacterium]